LPFLAPHASRMQPRHLVLTCLPVYRTNRAISSDKSPCKRLLSAFHASATSAFWARPTDSHAHEKWIVRAPTGPREINETTLYYRVSSLPLPPSTGRVHHPSPAGLTTRLQSALDLPEITISQPRWDLADGANNMPMHAQAEETRSPKSRLWFDNAPALDSSLLVKIGTSTNNK